MPHSDINIIYQWRGKFSNTEVHALHAEAFATRLFDESEWNWVDQCERYSLGWVVARYDGRFVGFANVLWDGLVHTFLEDVMVDATMPHRGIGVQSKLPVMAHKQLAASFCTSGLRRICDPSTSMPAGSAPHPADSWNSRRTQGVVAPRVRPRTSS
jgi:hypothetical protein